MKKVRAARPVVPEDDIAWILAESADALREGALAQGRHVRAFEEEFAAMTGSAGAVAVANGTAALIDGMTGIDGSADGEVLVQANGFYATAVSVLKAGYRLRLVDVDHDTMSPMPEDLEARSTPETRGVVITHLGGYVTPHLPAIRSWCDDRGIWLVEDCAHAHGAHLDGVHAGRFGKLGAFSFFPTKVITSAEGGMITSDDLDLLHRTRVLRDLGKEEAWRSWHVALGVNHRMSELHAIVGRTQLRRLDEFLEHRRAIASRYDELLRDCDGITIQQAPGSSFYKYVVFLDDDIDRSVLREELAASGIELSGEVYEAPLHAQPVLAPWVDGTSFPVAEQLCRSHACLPVHVGMAIDDTEFVVDALVSALPRSRAGR